MFRRWPIGPDCLVTRIGRDEYALKRYNCTIDTKDAMMTTPTDNEKIACVDAWLADISEASRRWKTARAAQKASEDAVSHLEQIRDRMRSVPPELEARMDEAIAKNAENAARAANAAALQSELESGFYAVLSSVTPGEVAEAWRMRCMEGATWLRCSQALHYNRQHLERLSRAAKLAVYGEIPSAYRQAANR